jgi:hypothetical protein
MAQKIAKYRPQGQDIARLLRNGAMGLLILVFMGLCAVFVRWFQPFIDDRIIMPLQLLIFVVIGYYFGRLPSYQNEQTLKNEIIRQTQRADAAQHAKEQAQQAREALEEKIKNLKTVLAPAVRASGDDLSAPGRNDSMRSSVVTALSILSS